MLKLKFCSVQIHVYLTHLTSPINGTFANIVDPDQTPQNAASDQCLHCLHYVQEFL